MPTYEYACTACGHKFEEFQSISAKPIRKCPECGKNKVQRLISAGAGFIFKGSGFYATDYRSDSYKAAAKSEASNGKPAGDKPADKAASSSGNGSGQSGSSTAGTPASTASSTASPAKTSTTSAKSDAA